MHIHMCVYSCNMKIDSIIMCLNFVQTWNQKFNYCYIYVATHYNSFTACIYVTSYVHMCSYKTTNNQTLKDLLQQLSRGLFTPEDYSIKCFMMHPKRFTAIPRRFSYSIAIYNIHFIAYMQLYRQDVHYPWIAGGAVEGEIPQNHPIHKSQLCIIVYTQ